MVTTDIMQNRREESGYRKPTGGSARWELRRWRIKSFSVPDHWRRNTVNLVRIRPASFCASGQQVLNQIWEEDFQDFSYGFRPGSHQHKALDALYVGITSRKVNFVLDLDIRSFFDKVGHDHMERFIRHRIEDERLVRLILKWLDHGRRSTVGLIRIRPAFFCASGQRA